MRRAERVKKSILSLFVLLFSIIGATPAFATSLIDATFAGSGGFWFGNFNKGYSFINNIEGPVPFTSYLALDNDFFGTKRPTSVYMNWMAAPGPNNDRELTSSTVNFYSGTELLLSLTALPDIGRISMIPGVGAAAEFNLVGAYSAVNGTFASLITSPLSIGINFSHGLVYNGADFHFTGGRIQVEEELPEPASMVLLMSGLIGISARRKLRQN